MADRIHIQTEHMEELAAQLQQLYSSLDALENRIRSIRVDQESGSFVRIRFSSGSFKTVSGRLNSGDTKACLKSAAAGLERIGSYTRKLSSNVREVCEQFEDTERMLVLLFDGSTGSQSIFNQICSIIGFPISQGIASQVAHKTMQQLISSGNLMLDGGFGFLIHGGLGYILSESGILATYEETITATGEKRTTRIHPAKGVAELTTSAGFSSIGPSTKFDLIEQEKLSDFDSYDLQGNKVEQQEKKKRGQAVDLLSVEKSTDISASLWQQTGAIEGECGRAEGSVGFINGEAHATGKGGLGVFVTGEDGVSELYLGGEGEVGASASVFQAKGTAEYELCDFVEVGAEGELTALEAEAALSGGLGIVGNELVAYVKGGAEANLVKAEGEAYVDVAGVKGSVGGSVQVGIGAEFEAGYNDGIITLGGTLSFGLGASVNLALDVSGFVDNVSDLGEGVMETFADGFSSFCAWVS